MLTNGNDIITIGDNWVMPPKRNVNLIQTTGGTISASPLQGYDGEVVTLSNSPSSGYIFDGYNVNGSTLYDSNKFTFNKSDVNVSANWFLDPIPSNKSAKIGDYTWTTFDLDIDDGLGGIYVVDEAYIGGGVDGRSYMQYMIKVGPIYYYTWDAAQRVANNIRGWHIPYRYEWENLFDYSRDLYNSITHGSPVSKTDRVSNPLCTINGWLMAVGNIGYDYTRELTPFNVTGIGDYDIETHDISSDSKGNITSYWIQRIPTETWKYVDFDNGINGMWMSHYYTDNYGGPFALRLVKDHE